MRAAMIAAEHVGRTAGCERDDQGHRPRRIILRDRAGAIARVPVNAVTNAALSMGSPLVWVETVVMSILWSTPGDKGP